MVAHAGVHPARKLVGLVPVLSDLHVVRSEAASDDPEHLVLAVVTVLDRALQGLAGSPTGAAARILLGLDHDTRHYNMTVRRERAASELFPDGRGEKTFRTRDEPELLGVVAEQLLRLETSTERHAAAPQQILHPTVVPGETPPAAPRTAGQRRRRLGAAAGATVLAVAVAMVVVRESRDGDDGGAPVTSTTGATEAAAAAPFALRDQFTDPRSQWPAYDTTDRLVTTTGGQYQALLKKFPSSAPLEAPWPDLPENVRVEAKATKMSPEPGSFGVFCRGREGERYRGVIDLNGDWRVEKIVRPPTAPAQRLAAGSSPAIATGDNVVALGCAGGQPGQGPVRLTFSVNGTVVAADVSDPGPPLVAGRAGVEVVSNRSEVRVWFDDFAVTA